MTKTTVKGVIATFIPCCVFWLLLTMSLAPREIIGGLIVCLATAIFTARFFVHDEPFKLLNPVRFLLLLFYVCVIFLWELIKANVSMAVTVLGNQPIKQAIVKVPVHGITNPYALAFLADCITLTPGTITMDVVDEDGKISMYIYWLTMTETDREKAGDIIKGRMEKWIGRVWA
jgi:multicomponent Na+:H+ antiporter subunit E